MYVNFVRVESICLGFLEKGIYDIVQSKVRTLDGAAKDVIGTKRKQENVCNKMVY